jgi:hypothetical protein
MRILIIAGVKVGGTSFGNWLSLELGIPFSMEPDSIGNNNQWLDGDCVTKIIYSIDMPTLINTNWDKIIGITRTNILECAISSLWGGDNKSEHTKYTIPNGWTECNMYRIQNEMLTIENMHKCIINLPIFQITYENIFETKMDINRIKTYVGLNDLKYLDYLDIANKLRNNTSTKLI